MSENNWYVPKSMMHSFTMPCEPTERNLKMVEQACRMRVDDLNNQAAEHNLIIDEDYKKDRTKKSEMRHHCNLSYEVQIGLHSIRVNLTEGTAKDAMMIGYNFCALQMNPSWKETP